MFFNISSFRVSKMAFAGFCWLEENWLLGIFVLLFSLVTNDVAACSVVTSKDSSSDILLVLFGFWGSLLLPLIFFFFLVHGWWAVNILWHDELLAGDNGNSPIITQLLSTKINKSSASISIQVTHICHKCSSHCCSLQIHSLL